MGAAFRADPPTATAAARPAAAQPPSQPPQELPAALAVMQEAGSGDAQGESFVICLCSSWSCSEGCVSISTFTCLLFLPLAFKQSQPMLRDAEISVTGDC